MAMIKAAMLAIVFMVVGSLQAPRKVAHVSRSHHAPDKGDW
jgi:hypothetical protein